MDTPLHPNAEVAVISATVWPVKASADSTLPPSLRTAKGSTDGTAYRLTSKGLSDTAAAAMNMDPDYMGDKASQYYALLGEGPHPTSKPTAEPMEFTDPGPPLHPSLTLSLRSQKQAKLKG